MKKQRLLRYCGIFLILLPFLGLYEYMKNFAYILIGATLLLNSKALATQERDSSKRVAKPTNQRATFPKIVVENTDTIIK